MFDKCRNMVGPLRHEMKEKLRAVIDNPNEKTWDDAYGVIVGADGWTTLWQAVVQVDPEFPQSADLKEDHTTSWKKIPDSLTIVRAIKKVTEKPVERFPWESL